jgi:hypothetical protein
VPIIQNFSTAQSSGNLYAFTITDTSTGSDPLLSGRLITCLKYDGNALTPVNHTTTYIVWPIGSSSLLINDILDKDYCLDITVLWYTGSTIGYSKTTLTLFTGYTDFALRQLTQKLAANKKSITANNFWTNKNKLRVLRDDAAQAVSLLNDQTIAQFCLDEAKKLTDNTYTFF